MPPPEYIVKEFPEEGDLQLFRLEKLREFQCVRCRKNKKSKTVAVQGGDWSKLLCNGCYGFAQSKNKAKGKKEPTDSHQNKDQKAAELVLSIGVEGGGVSIYRTALASGDWQFHEEGTSMWILDDDDGGMEEGWDHSSSKPFKTIQETLRSIAEDGSWVLWYPISIHPEYRNVIWGLVQEIVRHLPDERKRWWVDGSGKKWQRLLRRKVQLEPLRMPEKKTIPAKTPTVAKKARSKTPESDLFGPKAEDA